MDVSRDLALSAARQMWQCYVRAERLLPWNAARLTSDLVIKPRWIDSDDRFWYRWKTLKGVEFVLVDPGKGRRAPAFDHERLAAALSQATGVPCTANRLPFEEIEFSADGQAIVFDIATAGAGGRWTCDLTSYACMRIGDTAQKPPAALRSPDGQWEAFTRGSNVWLRSLSTGEERAITRDGETNYAYGDPLLSPLTSAGIEPPPPPVVIWSPDSSKLLFCRIDQREAPQFHLVQSLPKDGSIRPQLHSFAYPLPGDKNVPTAQLVCADLHNGTLTRIDIEPVQLQYHGPPISSDWVWWSADSQFIYLVRQGRGYFQYDLCAVDASTGTARVVAAEESQRGIDPSLQRGRVSIRVIADGSQVIWYSQRDGRGHLYLYDADSGALVRQLTSGSYTVSRIEYVDEAAGLVYFSALGREADRDPYYAHLYRVSLDGGEPQLVTDEDADHSVALSPGGKYVIDSFSTMNQPPAIVLRAADGTKICDLEKAEIDALVATGWKPPQRFRAKARDGSTDMYGVIFRPSDLDPARQYPVIDYIYGGPQVNQAPAAFADAVRGRENNFWQAQALAELGFIVVMMDGLGMPGRSKAHHDFSYRNLGDNGLADHIAALRQLADRYPYFDLSRVGIFGHSAGGYASARAMFTWPDFYKVCVSSAGNHDHRLDKATWVERYMGIPLGEHYRQQANQTDAHNLKGKLLLIHGEMDENVHVASTLVVVDALIKANKDFDLLIMPNQSHACTNHPYFIRRRWDYFVRHLLGAEPPSGYQLK